MYILVNNDLSNPIYIDDHYIISMINDLGLDGFIDYLKKARRMTFNRAITRLYDAHNAKDDLRIL